MNTKAKMTALICGMTVLTACGAKSGNVIEPVQNDQYEMDVYQLVNVDDIDDTMASDIEAMPDVQAINGYTFDIYDKIVINGKSVKVLSIGSDVDGTITINGGKDEKGFFTKGYTFTPIDDTGLFYVEE